MYKKRMVFVVGRTATGKDAMVSKFCKQYWREQVKSYATRPQREGEGFTHQFIKSEDVDKYRNDFAAYTKIGKYEYFTTKSQLLNGDEEFYIVDPNGIEYIEDTNLPLDVLVIYICVDKDIIRERAIKIRKDDVEKFEKRASDENEQFDKFEKQKAYDIMIDNNGDFDEAYRKFVGIAHDFLEFGVRPKFDE